MRSQPILDGGRRRRPRRIHRRDGRRHHDDARPRRLRSTPPRCSARRSHADEIQIWTDVDGMLTADPRVVERRAGRAAAVVRRSVGAGILRRQGAAPEHDPAGGAKTASRSGSSTRCDPDGAGSLITRRCAGRRRPLTALACKRNITVVDVTSTRMLLAHGFLRRVFEVFEQHATSVDVVTTPKSACR